MSYENISDYMDDHTAWLRISIPKLQQMQNGKLNIGGSFTLTANVGSTVLTFSVGVLAQTSVLLWTPTTANASAEIGGGTIYISAIDVNAQTITLTHANNAQTDRIFKYVLVG